MDKKVVLIELDLRKPKVSEQFNVSRHTGLSNYLIGKAAMEECIKTNCYKKFIFNTIGARFPQIRQN